MQTLRWAVVLLLMAAVCCCQFAMAEEMPGEEDEGEWIQGIVKVVKNAEGKVTSIVIETTDWDDNDEEITVPYHVTLDAQGNKLVALNGKEVEAFGKLSKKGEGKKAENWIVVKKFEEIKAIEDEE